MKKFITPLLLTSLLSLTATSTIASETAWKYEGKQGSAHWGELSEKFGLCSTGVNQSPINITSVIEANLPPLTMNYHKSQVSEINNGHTVQANITGNNTFTNDAGTFDLLQFHFHAPSENTIEGKSFPLEAHFVHADQDGRLAVIGVMFELGEENSELAKLWKNMPEDSHSQATLLKELSALNLMPKEKSYYRFNGSLTTPPCTEGVRWFVLKDTIKASKAQINKFRTVMGTDTNRPVQPINARVILQ
ncbi:MAG: carbonic anhydrase family protein [Colwellia sp.]|nr:carbonic anhydrase family protein [Colwellia sp.]